LIGVVARMNVSRLTVPANHTGTLRVVPLHKSIDVGAGSGHVLERVMDFGECGVIVDGRNRPFESASFSVEKQEEIYRNLGLL
jgi:hypothetical protein